MRNGISWRCVSDQFVCRCSIIPLVNSPNKSSTPPTATDASQKSSTAPQAANSQKKSFQDEPLFQNALDNLNRKIAESRAASFPKGFPDSPSAQEALDSLNRKTAHLRKK